jgi:hypothetical protein
VANTYQTGTISVDTTGLTTGSATNLKVAYVLYTSAASHDTLTLRDGTGGAIKFIATLNTAFTTQLFDFSAIPIRFKEGIHATLSSGSSAIIYTTNQGVI